MLLVAALAFLLASFPARNSDLLAHLAAGERLARGNFPLGPVQPLPSGLPVEPAWVFDGLSYGLYSTGSGAGLVFVKACGVALLSLVLMRLSGAGRGVWVPAGCTALALLALSPRLLLQPATLSWLLLALALAILQGSAAVVRGRGLPLPPWQLATLFVVWANVDHWFVPGLGVVALVWLGQALDEGRRPEGAGGGVRLGVGVFARVALAWAVLAVACLLNPAHVHAFAPPPELAGLAHATSPFQAAFLAEHGSSPAAVAYYSLLGLGLLSFAAHYPRWSWRWLLPWLGLALLSAAQVRAIPFFAVVAGPTLAVNLRQELARRCDSRRRSWRWAAAAGRGLVATALLVLVVCAWPGWLQGRPFGPRRWAVEPPPSLERGAATVRRWRQEGKLGPEAVALHLSPETAAAFAWFCPEQAGLQDDELAAAIRGGTAATRQWQARMRQAQVTHLILHDADRGRLFVTLAGLLADPTQFPLLFQEGDLAVFGWRDPDAKGPTDPFRDLQLDFNRLAFHPSRSEQAPPGPSEQAVETRRWWEALWKPAPPPAIDHDEARLYLFHAEVLRRDGPSRHMAAWEATQGAGLLGASAGWVGPACLVDAHLRLVAFRPNLPSSATGYTALSGPDRLALAWQKGFTLGRDDTPPALLYLAVRAARRAVAVNPQDSRAFLVLGESYLRFLHATRERGWGKRMKDVIHLRRVQASAALNRAVSLEPTLAQGHLALGGLYREMGYLDLALKHLRVYLDLKRKAGPPAGTAPDSFLDEAALFQEELDRLSGEVEARENKFTVAAAGKTVLDRALLAMQAGLAARALAILLESHVSAFGPRGMELELELLLHTGRPEDVRDWTGPDMSPQQKAQLGAAFFHRLRIHALAALGDYAQAEQECSEWARELADGGQGQERVQFRDVMALTVGKAALDGRIVLRSIPSLVGRTLAWAEFQARLRNLAQSLRQEADLAAFRGLLALEEGDVREARAAFREALALWKGDAAAASGAGLDFSGRVVAQDGLGWLE